MSTLSGFGGQLYSYLRFIYFHPEEEWGILKTENILKGSWFISDLVPDNISYSFTKFWTDKLLLVRHDLRKKIIKKGMQKVNVFRLETEIPDGMQKCFGPLKFYHFIDTKTHQSGYLLSFSNSIDEWVWSSTYEEGIKAFFDQLLVVSDFLIEKGIREGNEMNTNILEYYDRRGWERS